MMIRSAGNKTATVTYNSEWNRFRKKRAYDQGSLLSTNLGVF